MLTEMAFDTEALNHFFQDHDELGIVEATQVQLVEEGIAMAEDPQCVNADSMKKLTNNLCRPSGAARKPHAFSIISQTKMIDTANHTCHCLAMGREVSPDHFHCTVTQNFAHQWKALEKQQDGNQQTPLEIGNDLNIP